MLLGGVIFMLLSSQLCLDFSFVCVSGGACVVGSGTCWCPRAGGWQPRGAARCGAWKAVPGFPPLPHVAWRSACVYRFVRSALFCVVGRWMSCCRLAAWPGCGAVAGSVVAARQSGTRALAPAHATALLGVPPSPGPGRQEPSRLPPAPGALLLPAPFLLSLLTCSNICFSSG